MVFFGLCIVLYSVVAAKVKDQNSEEENEIVEDGHKSEKVADHLSVMYLPCQDPMLVKIYQGLPALPCIVQVPVM